MDQKKIEVVVDRPLPKDVLALKGFLGLISYYRRFVKRCGSIAKPLTAMLKKEWFNWIKEAIGAFEDLKRVMTKTPVLALLDFSKLFKVHTYASGEEMVQDWYNIGAGEETLSLFNEEGSEHLCERDVGSCIRSQDLMTLHVGTQIHHSD